MEKEKEKDKQQQKSEKVDKEIEKAEVKQESMTPQIMKKGDYIVHILVEEIRNLISKDETSLVLPTIKIQCLGAERRTTKLKQGCANYTFSEHFYFERNNMAVEELDSEKIIIEVIDGNNTNREDYLGIYEMDFTSIYNNKDHSIHNFWVALANPESIDITKVRGFLKLSASVLQENDPRVELTFKSTDDPNAMCVIPPQVKMEYRQISIFILKGEQFPDMDYIFKASRFNKECNGFIHVKYLGLDVKSSVRDQKGDTIIWNEVLDIPVSFPVVSQKIVIQVWDKDPTQNDIIGSFEIKVDDVINDKYKDLQYIPIYGAPVGRIGKYTDKMNANSEIGSLWKGRVLMKVEYKKTEAPKKAVRKIDDKAFLDMAGKLGKANRWFFDIFLYEACFLPTESDEYAVKFCIEENTREFTSKKASKRNVSFNYANNLMHQTLTKDVKNLPDLFVYLVNDAGVSICFQRISVDTFYNNDDVIIIKLLPDPSIGKLGEFVYSGIIKVKIKLTGNEMSIPLLKDIAPSVGKEKNEEESEEEDGGLESHMKKRKAAVKEEAKKEPVKVAKKNFGEYMIIANIHMSRYLIAGDSDGTSDPFVVLRIGEIEKQTSTRYDTVNCIWNESLIFEKVELDINDKSTWPIIFLQVMDEDHLRHDMLAYNYIWLSDSKYDVDKLSLLTPKWHQLHLPVSNRPQGQILVSFYIIDMKKTDLIKKATLLDITPETELYSCEINILGLRDLKPLSVMPVKKPFIAFDLNSINISGKDDNNLKIIKTQPKNSGRNPTINTVIKFDVKLPKDEIFMPDMQSVVYDYVLSGMLNQMLGVFHIPLKDVIKENDDLISLNKRNAERKMNVLLGNKLGLTKERIMRPEEIDLNFGVNNNNNNNSNNLNQKKENSFSNPKNVQNDFNIELVEMNLKNSKSQVEAGKIKTNSYADLNIINNNDAGDEKKAMIPQNKDDVSNKANKSNNNIMLDVNTPPKSNTQDPLNPNDPSKFILKPVYKVYNLPGNKPGSKNYKEFIIEDESKAPPREFYHPVGFNKEKKDDKKHYRRIFNCNLEDAKELGLESPFYKIPLRRGKFVDQSEETGIFEALKDQDSKIIKRFKKGQDVQEAHDELDDQANKFYDNKTYGDFKGLIRIVEKNKLNDYVQFVDEIRKKGDTALMNDFNFLTNFEDLAKRILVEKECIVRVYILDLGELAKKDAFSESDPFLKIYLANQKVDESANAKDDMANCSWCKYYDFNAVLPGDGNIKIEVWDYDPLFTDELIGVTTVDVEDRFFDLKWKDIKDKPIEKRILYHPDLEGPQGWITCWVEVFEKKDRSTVVKYDISPPPTVPLEMRLIVWEIEDTPCMDVEDMSDYYVVAFIDSQNKQSTDVHYRCEKGYNGSFNWRIVMPIMAPTINTKLNIQVMDNDIFSSDDYVSGSVLELNRLIKDVYALDIPIKFTESFWLGLNESNAKSDIIQFVGNSDTKQKEKDKFWLQLYQPGTTGTEKGGRVLLSLEMLPGWKAQICQVGKGRDEPNTNPYLPPPMGRFQFSLNPFRMLNQCVGAQYRRKFYCALCCALIIFYLIFVLPFTLLHISGEAVNPFNYISKGGSSSNSTSSS